MQILWFAFMYCMVVAGTSWVTACMDKLLSKATTKNCFPKK